ncbi:hypothetical protein MKEN_01033000 [Mycena kentingensis (nom. inval.)]|nr:hypothetical protein MKEN_01033000 [Mycena kentingensis (nom. inval.)]
MLSSSTTETKSYTLEKYSRAVSNRKEGGSSDWQHFTNPILRLIIDSRMTLRQLESMRMRVVWSMNDGSGADKDVVLEDLDLCAFSSLGGTGEQSPPLKGVYRDTTFGLRYLNVYRRFQVSFSSSAATRQLVDTIHVVCPCKCTEASAAERKKTIAAPQRVQDPVQSSTFIATQWEGLPKAPPPSRLPISRPPDSSLNSRAPNALMDVERPAPSPTTLEVEPDVPLREPTPPPPPPTSEPERAHHRDTSMPPPSSASAQMPSSSAPAPPSSNPRPAVPNTPDADALVASLRDATTLYDLSYGQLARIVGDVVREDGFPRLMENMSSMWSAKALAS